MRSLIVITGFVIAGCVLLSAQSSPSEDVFKTYDAQRQKVLPGVVLYQPAQNAGGGTTVIAPPRGGFPVALEYSSGPIQGIPSVAATNTLAYIRASGIGSVNNQNAQQAASWAAANLLVEVYPAATVKEMFNKLRTDVLTHIQTEVTKNSIQKDEIATVKDLLIRLTELENKINDLSSKVDQVIKK